MPPEGEEEILQGSSEQIGTEKSEAKAYIKLQLDLAPADDKLVRIEVTKTGHMYTGGVFVRA
jgi:hypothetical protein